ncbi:MAG: hypothetical protein E7547_09135 [Ruminococcaceae bacterium]|nr:hypothetical protein [Oscillospiraceae bacterium]
MSENNLYAVDKDYCPDNDNIIMKGQCGGCEHYRGFDMYLGQPCVKCSFYTDIKNNEQTED